MSDDRFLHNLEVEVETELQMVDGSLPDELAPVAEWQFDPADVQREEAGLRNLLGAVEALEGEPRTEQS